MAWSCQPAVGQFLRGQGCGRAAVQRIVAGVSEQLPLRHVILTGVVMGVTAAAIVWWLERFESDRLHREVRSYLGRYDEFRDWLEQKADEA